MWTAPFWPDSFAELFHPELDHPPDQIQGEGQPGNQLGGVGFSNGRYLAMVNNGVDPGEDGITAVTSAQGMFLSAPVPLRIQVSGQYFGDRNNQFGFDVTGPSGQVVVIEAASAADASWAPIVTNILAAGSWLFSDSQWTGCAKRFYRVRYQ